jgi:hypothetical protein
MPAGGSTQDGSMIEEEQVNDFIDQFRQAANESNDQR